MTTKLTSCRTLLLLLGSAVPAMPTALAQPTVIAVPAARISDEAVHADLSGYEQIQSRIQALNDRGRPVSRYHLSKAQCWLDVSFHEYTRNDRSDFPQAALTESETLIAALEADAASMPTDTPLVNDATHLRDDLWQRLRRIHGTPGFGCAQQQVACAEVELVHAGNEYSQQQWRHAKPYIQIAESLVDQAETLASQCHVAAPEPVSMEVLFEFDQDQARGIGAESLQRLDRVLAGFASPQRPLARVTVVGHADKLQGRGARYNHLLSQRRANTVGMLLVERGVEASLIRYDYRGDTQPVQDCDESMPRAELLGCLSPNRRVAVRFELAD